MEKHIMGFTEAWVKAILEQYVEAIIFRPLIAWGIVSPASDSTFKFPIYLRNNFEEPKEQKITLIHEIVHIFCTLRFIRASEETVETFAKMFYQDNYEFTCRVWECVMRAKCTKNTKGYEIYTDIKLGNRTWPVQTSFCF